MDFKVIDGGVCAAKGFKASGVYCAIKENPTKKNDIAMIVSDVMCNAAGVYTQNKVKGAPVIVTKKNLAKSGGRAKAVIVNSKNANTCNADGEEKAVTTVTWDQKATGTLVGEYFVNYVKENNGGKCRVVELTNAVSTHCQERFVGLHEVIDAANADGCEIEILVNLLKHSLFVGSAHLESLFRSDTLQIERHVTPKGYQSRIDISPEEAGLSAKFVKLQA